MQGAAEIADPLVDVRDVVETFRQYGVTLADWHKTLQVAVLALDDPQGAVSTNVLRSELSAHLRSVHSRARLSWAFPSRLGGFVAACLI